MAITFDQVRRTLLAFEPDYKAAARQGSQLLPHLKTLVTGSDRLLASKAAYLAGLIDDDRAIDVLDSAAKSSSPTIRIAAASGLRNSKRPAAAGLLMSLLGDRDAGVRKVAIKASATRGNSALIARLDDLSRSDPSPGLRTLAGKAASEARGRRTA
jgi:HEAT repeat protein